MKLEKIMPESNEYHHFERNNYYYGGRDENNNDYIITKSNRSDDWNLEQLIYNDDDIYSPVIIYGHGENGKYYLLKVEVSDCLRMIMINPDGTVQGDTVMNLLIKDDGKGTYYSIKDINNGPHPKLAGYLGIEKRFTNMYGEEYTGYAADDKYLLFFLQKNAELIPEIISMESEEKSRKKK